MHKYSVTSSFPVCSLFVCFSHVIALTKVSSDVSTGVVTVDVVKGSAQGNPTDRLMKGLGWIQFHLGTGRLKSVISAGGLEEGIS